MSENNVVALNETKPRPKRGRGGTQNFPTVKPQPQTPQEKADCSKLLSQILEDYKQPRVKNDDELIDAFDAYFQRWVDRGSLPTVEGLYMSTGFTIEYMRNICNGSKKGFSDKTASIIKKAKDILQRYDAEKTVAGEINPIVYFFRAKNYYGMVDKQEHVITANTREESDYSAEDIAKKYLVDGDATFVESTASDS